jgi:hypothetical protein
MPQPETGIRFRVTLRIGADENLDFDAISRQLAAEPSFTNRRSTYAVWGLQTNLPESTDLEDHVTNILERVTNDLGVWDRLAAITRIDLFVGVMCDRLNVGFSLSPTTTTALGERGIALGFDIYALGQAEDNATKD